MALTDKNILITPNIGSANDPRIVFSGADASTGAQNITLMVYPTNSGTLSFEGSAGQLLSISNSMSGTIFSANDMSGIPSIEVLDSGLVKLAQYSGNVLIGTGTDNGSRLQVNGVTTVSGNNYTQYGPNSTWGAYLRIGGNGTSVGANIAGIATTNGNLHIDAATTNATYLNFYSGTGGVAFGSGSGATVAWMGPDGDLWKGNGDNTGVQYVQNTGTWNISVTGTSANVTGTVAIANGGSGSTTAAGARTNFGATTVGSNLFTLANPSAITFLRVNADNTVSTLNAADFRTAIGAGTSSTVGTVTSVSGTGTVSGLTLSGTVTTSGNLTLGGTLTVTPSNFASQVANTVLAAPNGSAGAPTFRALVAADIPILNQNTTGSAATLTTTRTIWGQNFNGGANVTGNMSGISGIAGTTQTIANNFGAYQHIGGWGVARTAATAVLVNTAYMADILSSTRTINGVGFNGSSDITIPSLYDTNYRRITNPGGAEYITSTSTLTGAIAITLPVGMINQMVRMTIKVYEYTTNEQFEIHCGGYAYDSGSSKTWTYNPFAYIIGNPQIDRRFTVRFGYNSTSNKGVIYIGELAQTWSYPQVYVTDVQIGYNGQQINWTTGWQIGFEATAFMDVTATIQNAQVGYAVSGNTANSVVLRDASGNFSAGNITATTLTLGTVQSTGVIQVLNGGSAQGMKLGSLVVSNSYGNNAPTNGIYSTGQIQSAVTTGTAPFIVASTTAVTNLNADSVDGFGNTSTPGARWTSLVTIAGDGVTEAGRYIDFHSTSADATDYTFRLDNNANGSLLTSGTIQIGGTLAITGTTKTGGHFYAGTTAPTLTNRLNYDGYLYATGFCGDGSQLTGISGIATNVTTTATSKTLVVGEYCTVTAAGQTITLPASPAAGNSVKIGVLNFTNTVIARNSQNIMSLAENMTIDAADSVVTLTFIDATRGWRIG